MIRKYRMEIAGVIVLLGLLAGCTGTKVTSLWADEQFKKKPETIFVVGAVKDRGPRRLLEEEFARQLKKKGYLVTISTVTIPGETMPGREAVQEAVGKAKADVILVPRFIKKASSETYVPTRRYAVPQGFETSWEGYFGVSQVVIADVSYSYTVLVLETSVFNAADGRTIWSAVTETKYQGSAIEQIKPFVSAIIKSLAKSGIIP